MKLIVRVVGEGASLGREVLEAIEPLGSVHWEANLPADGDGRYLEAHAETATCANALSRRLSALPGVRTYCIVTAPDRRPGMPPDPSAPAPGE